VIDCEGTVWLAEVRRTAAVVALHASMGGPACRDSFLTEGRCLVALTCEEHARYETGSSQRSRDPYPCRDVFEARAAACADW